jgi:hypothetical protein
MTTVTLLLGVGSGALHAVTGPDHLLSLGPSALSTPHRAWRIGLVWGVGHGVGTLALSAPLLLFDAFFDLHLIASVSDKLAGLALIALALWSLRGMRGDAPATTTGQPFWVGAIHGLTGAGALLLVLPFVAERPVDYALAFIAAFAVGSAVSMAALTMVLARVGAGLAPRTIARSVRALTLASLALGCSWLVL